MGRTAARAFSGFDLNGGYKADLIFAESAGTMMPLSLMDGVVGTAQGFLGTGGNTFKVAADTNGDGHGGTLFP